MCSLKPWASDSILYVHLASNNLWSYHQHTQRLPSYWSDHTIFPLRLLLQHVYHSNIFEYRPMFSLYPYDFSMILIDIQAAIIMSVCLLSNQLQSHTQFIPPFRWIVANTTSAISIALNKSMHTIHSIATTSGPPHIVSALSRSSCLSAGCARS